MPDKITHEKKEIIKGYPNEIWQAKDGRWKTHLPDTNRKLIAKSSLEELEQIIIDFYYEKEKQERLKQATLEKLYPDWLEYKQIKSSSATYGPRLDCDWKRYYQNDAIIRVPIVDMDDFMLETWAYKLIDRNQPKMTKKQYYNVTTIIRGILDYAVRIKIIPTNPFRLFKIGTGRFRKSDKKKSETQVYLENEEVQMIHLAEQEYIDTGYTACLAICLNFYLGLRSGELMALRESDRDGNYLYVQRQEVRNQIMRPDGTWHNTGYMTDDYLKGDKEVRELYLTEGARRYWDMIVQHNHDHNCSGSYLIMHNGKHVHYPTVNHRLTRYCRKLNIPIKSSHKIRKTVLSTMIDEVGLDEAQAWGGHSSKTTLLKNYHYSRKNADQKEQAIEKALNKQKSNVT